MSEPEAGPLHHDEGREDRDVRRGREQEEQTGALDSRRHAPTVSMVEANIWYHTAADKPDVVPPQGLERSARAFAFLLDKADRASRGDLERGTAPIGSAK